MSATAPGGTTHIFRIDERGNVVQVGGKNAPPLIDSNGMGTGVLRRQHRLTQLESPLILYRPTFNHRSYATSAGGMCRYVTAFKQNGPKTRLESLVKHIIHFL